MPDIPIDIRLSDDILSRIKPPPCDESLKLPTPEKLSICLPFGGSVQGIVDVTKAIPDDCSLTFSILAQMPPLLASLGCFIKLLKLAKPLMDFVQAVPKLVTKPQGVIEAVGELVPVLVDIVACFTNLMPIGITKFIRDLLHMIAKLLKCIAQEIKSIAKLMGGLEISIQTAQASGNKALQDQLNCAKDNAKAQADAVMGSMDMITAVLAVAEPLLGIAGVSLTLPTLGSAQGADELEQVANTLLQVGASVDQIATGLDALGTC